MLLQAAAEVLFTLQDARLSEASGIAAASAADTYHLVNDSNDELRFSTVDGTGRTTDVTAFRGVDVRDLEDVALGPGPTVVLADIGDNAARRPRVLVHRVPEGGGELQTVSLTYEDGAHDAEALLVHPRTGQTLLVTKGVLGAGVYEASASSGDGVLRRVGSVQTSATGTPGGPAVGAVAQVVVTGGAVSPDGRRLAVRTYTDAYLYDVPGDDLVAALRGVPVVVPLPETPQGEAVTWSRDGTALVTTTEGRGAPVHRVPVPPAAPVEAPLAAATPGSAAADDGPARGSGTPVVVASAVLAALVAAGLAVAAARRRSSR